MNKVLVMPQFNEAKTIIDVLTRAHEFVDEIVVVDDGSTDGSGRLVREWMDSRPGVTLITLASNRGMSGALLAGFCYVNAALCQGRLGRETVIINMDADGQHRAEEINRGVDLLLGGNYDVVLGRRDLSGYPRFKQVGNRMLSWWASLLSGFRYHDVECGFRFMRAEVIPSLLVYFTGRKYGCAQEIGIITALLGAKIENTFESKVIYYRPGAKISDGFVNLSMGALAFARVKLRVRNDVDKLTQHVLGEAIIASTSRRG